MSNAELLGFLDEIRLDESIRDSLRDDMADTPPDSARKISDYVLDKYGVDLTARYASIEIPHPFGKGAGQLSMHEKHVLSDRTNALAYTVLKSAVGVTSGGEVGIDDWQKSSPKMVLETRRACDGRDGWTVTWKGRGWVKGIDAYIELYRISLEQNPGYPVIPSMMVAVADPELAKEQGKYCIGRLSDVFRTSGSSKKFLIEIDISPTLSLLPGSEDDETFSGWVRNSVAAFRDGLAGRGQSIVKIPNAGRGAGYQLDLVKAALDEGGNSIAAMIVGNRLFDRTGEFEGQKGIAYGGWDLSNINLETLSLFDEKGIHVDLIGTGNICSGRMMAEYAIRGCDSGQLHTFFQLPPKACRASGGNGGRVWRALRELLFHPDDGLIATLLGLEKSGKPARSEGRLKFSDLKSIAWSDLQ